MNISFSHPIEVRFRDCDPMGHVNNAVYLTYLEQARFAHWRALWGFTLEALPAGAPGVILARAEVDYRKPARYGDMLEVRIEPAPAFEAWLRERLQDADAAAAVRRRGPAA